MDIQVVLTAQDPKLGNRGDVIKVSPGYAHNFLIPHGKAKLATPENLKSFKLEKTRKTQACAERLAQANDWAGKISRLALTLEMPAGEAGKLYGAVTSQDIQAALQAQGVRIDRRGIQMEEPIRKLGAYSVPLKLHPEVHAVLKLEVARKKP